MSMLDIGLMFDGRYRIDGFIGSGGMSDVYLATDVKTGNKIALKVLKEEFSGDQEFVRRFRSEAEAVLHLSHEGIVKSYDVGEFCDCQYIALQYIEGKTLKEVIREEAPMKREKAIKITLRLCDALGHAHEKQIVHRDVKPENIIMESDEKPYITDFGIARFVDTGNTVTYAGNNVLGSVRYVSPEQARGEVVGPQSDIYSLGIVLYEMLTGKLPFDGDNTMAVVLKQVQEPMVPPLKLNPEIGEALNEVVLKATTKNSKDRYQNMAAFKRDLLKALKNPHKLISASEKEDEKRKASRHWIVVLCIVVALAIGAGILFFIVRDRMNLGADSIELPSFVLSSFNEAEKKAEKLGVNLVENESVLDESLPADVIVSQEPLPGTEVKEGQEVMVTVNRAGEMISMPEFLTMFVAEAEDELAELNLEVIWHYEPNEASEGSIFRQMPEAGIEIERGETIELWVSGEENSKIPMPSLISLDYEGGVQMLKSEGFENIFVQYVEKIDDEATNDVIVQQSRVAGEMISANEYIVLGVKRHQKPRYSLDWAINIDLSEQESEVLVIYREGDVQVIAFEQIMAAGKQALSFTVGAEKAGEKLVQVYVNQTLLREETVKLS